MTNVNIIPEVKTATKTFHTHTRRGTTIKISYLDLGKTPVVKAAEMIMNENTPRVKIRSLRKLIYRNRRFQRWCDKELIEYLKLCREKLIADTHAEVFGEPAIDGELYSVNGEIFLA